jgi:hypothetical protein
MCNAAENFLPLRFKSCGRSKIDAVKSGFQSLGTPGGKDSPTGSSRRSNRPQQLRTGAVLASLTFDGG